MKSQETESQAAGVAVRSPKGELGRSAVLSVEPRE